MALDFVMYREGSAASIKTGFSGSYVPDKVHSTMLLALLGSAGFVRLFIVSGQLSTSSGSDLRQKFREFAALVGAVLVVCFSHVWALGSFYLALSRVQLWRGKRPENLVMFGTFFSRNILADALPCANDG